MDYAAYAQPKETENFAHPCRISLGKVIVNGNYMHAVPAQCVQIRGQRLSYGFAFARFHFGNVAAVQHYAAVQLNVEMPLAYRAHCGFPYHGVSFAQYIVLFFAVSKAGLELVGFRAQLAVAQRMRGRLKLVYPFYQWRQLFQLRLAGVAQQFIHKTHGYRLSCIIHIIVAWKWHVWQSNRAMLTNLTPYTQTFRPLTPKWARYIEKQAKTACIKQ